MDTKNYRKTIHVDAVQYDGTPQMAKRIVDWLYLYFKADVSYLESYRYDPIEADENAALKDCYTLRTERVLFFASNDRDRDRIREGDFVFVEDDRVKVLSEAEFNKVYSII